MTDDVSLRVLLNHEHYMAVDKPAGLLVHPSWLSRHETQFAQFMAEDIAGQKLNTLHRLDRPTSGILLFGKSSDTARAMMPEFEQHRVEKIYLAVARGWLADSGIFDKPLKEDRDDIADKFVSPDKPAQKARTDFITLARTALPLEVGRYPEARYSLLAVSPKTGRRHQIRKHFRKASHHLIADTRYGDGRHNKALRVHFDWHTLGLRAISMRFVCPVSGQDIKLNAGLDDHWQFLFRIMGWQHWVAEIDQQGSEWQAAMDNLVRLSMTAQTDE